MLLLSWLENNKSNLVFIFLITLPAFLEARKFQINRESFATYLKFSGQVSALGNGPISGATGTATVPEYTISTNNGFEIGVSRFSSIGSIRFGIETVVAQPAAPIEATNGSTVLFTVNPIVTTVAAKLGIELNIAQWSVSRLGFYAGGGAAQVQVANFFDLTGDGETATGLTDFNEDARTIGYPGEGALFFETLFADTATILFEFGYRYLEITQLSHNAAVTNFIGTRASGATLNNSSGNPRSLSLSGAYGSLTFRWYLK